MQSFTRAEHYAENGGNAKTHTKIIEYKGEYTAMREARHHAAYYTKSMRGGAKLRAEIGKLERFEQLQELSYKILKEYE